MPRKGSNCSLWQVRLLKCEVDGIVVDISFNSVNGLCTLGFLEEMDRWIGSGHLFKRSVILVSPPPYRDIS